MRWRKLGHVYCPTGELPWARQYAHLPTPVLLDPDSIRVYFAALDEEKFGRFAARVLGADASAEKVAQLKDEYIQFSVHFQSRAWMHQTQ